MTFPNCSLSLRPMRYVALLPFCLLAACGGLPFLRSADTPPPGPPDVVQEDPAETADLPADETGGKPADQVGAGPQRTVASLGDPAQSGLWLKTPLVTSQRPGKIKVVASGAMADVTLIPLAGDAGAGSRLSLQAMQALGVSPADLVELEVVSTG